MSQQRHSSEIVVSIDDAQVQEAARKLEESFQRVGEAGARAMEQTSRAARQTTQTMAQPPAPPAPPAPATKKRKPRKKKQPPEEEQPPEETPPEEGPTPPPPPKKRKSKKKKRPPEEPEEPEEPPPPPVSHTALDDLGPAGMGNKDLDDLAAMGRKIQAASRARALEIVQNYVPPPTLAQRAGAYGLGVGRNLAVASPGMLATSAQGLFGGGGSSGVAQSLGALGGSVAGAFGSSRLASGIPFLGGILGGAISQRAARTGQIAALERPQTELALSGAQGVRGARSRFERLGISGLEGVGALRTLSRALGSQSPLFERGRIGATSDFLAESILRGIDPSAIGGFVRGGALGGGARTGTVGSMRLANRLVGTAREMNLTGAGAAQLLGIIAQNTQRIAAEGLSIDEESAAKFIRGIDSAALEGGARQLQGVGAARTFTQLSGALGGVASGFKGQFGGLAQGALTAAAARGGGGPLDVLRRLEDFRTNPERAINALREMGIEGDLLELILSALGLSTQQAGILRVSRSSELGDPITGLDRGTMRRGMQVSRAVQTAEGRILRQVEADPRSLQTFIQLNARLEELTLSLTKGDGPVVRSLSAIETGIGELMRLAQSGNISAEIGRAIREALF